MQGTTVSQNFLPCPLGPPCPLPRPLSPPLPLPLPLTSSFLPFGFCASSTNNVSSRSTLCSWKYRILLPWMDNESRDIVSQLQAVILMVLMCVFICMSIPEWWGIFRIYNWVGVRKEGLPVIVPCTVDLFLSLMVTVSLFYFIKNLRGGGGKCIAFFI